MPKSHIILTVLLSLFLLSCTDETKVTSISLNPTEMTLSIGETKQIELTINPLSSAIYNSKFWSSSDNNVAVVDNKGNVTAIYAGTCTITATVGGHKATCKITVETPEYDLTLDKATVYITGLEDETGAMTQVLRLYQSTLSMDEEGNVSGNGLMLHLALCSNPATDTLTTGTYIVEDSHREGTVKPGEYRQEGTSGYVTGSFLGQYTDAGLSVLLLSAGQVTISRTSDGSFSVSCDMEGVQQEQVKISWSGTPDKYIADTLPEPTQILYTSMVLKDTVVTDETATRHTLATLTDGTRTLQMLFRLPLSASDSLIPGRYMMSDDDDSFTISPSATTLTEDTETVDILSATIIVTTYGDGYAIDGSFRCDDGRDYLITRSEKKDKKTR